MISIKKVVNDIQNDGKYDALLDYVKKSLNTKEPTTEQIEQLVINKPYYIKEYKDLNRWGELSSVHIQKLRISNSDSQIAKETKEKINQEVEYLINAEEYEVASKKVIYLSWTGFIALPSIYVIDNLVRISTDLYTTNENHVYFSFLIVLIVSIWGYLKVTKNHKNQHLRYLDTQRDIRALVKEGLDKEYFSYKEIYRA